MHVGPIVRINPSEVHINDADWFDTLYAGPGSIRDKDPKAARIAGTPLSSKVFEVNEKAANG